MNRDTSRRFAYIETCLYWGGGITARQLGETFEIARPNAQASITAYRELHPNNLRYNPSLKRHEASDTFEAHYISDKPEFYLNYLRGNHLTSRFWKDEDWSELPIHDVDTLFRPYLQTNIIRTIVSAIQTQQALYLCYHAKAQTHYLTVAPNQLVYASRRYHVRAYSYDTNKYIDLVLSRIMEASFSEEDWVSSDEDKEWNTYIDLHFKPNPELPEQLRNTLLLDFRLEKGIYSITTRKALRGYVLREMERVDWQAQTVLWKPHT
ncbi:MAG TPA: WYL domain-containing protein [Candidatus Thiothrix moscowensis]|uniref:WYL domain-containing protein n=1 Tax=Thiothrix sp. UBA2016 TaxID=1947695 RepID=UPI0025D293F6|nr:WYL domain-containing protein [Thiothrix sp. UBA2016]HRJ53072.1 WYL domain-containing protein [Candidatus Thiothrix moscowensis]HRJ93063.1 WYL domain-containing protein [Candidatus Thiothrix moscowensis]